MDKTEFIEDIENTYSLNGDDFEVEEDTKSTLPKEGIHNPANYPDISCLRVKYKKTGKVQEYPIDSDVTAKFKADWDSGAFFS